MIEMLRHSLDHIIYYNDRRSETWEQEGVDYDVVVIMLFLCFVEVKAIGDVSAKHKCNLIEDECWPQHKLFCLQRRRRLIMTKRPHIKMTCNFLHAQQFFCSYYWRNQIFRPSVLRVENQTKLLGGNVLNDFWYCTLPVLKSPHSFLGNRHPVNHSCQFAKRQKFRGRGRAVLHGPRPVGIQRSITFQN